LGDEYTERKIRVYEPKVVKGEGKVSKYFVKPITKAMGFNKGKSDNERRLTA